jgi:hypothetical protein
MVIKADNAIALTSFEGSLASWSTLNSHQQFSEPLGRLVKSVCLAVCHIEANLELESLFVFREGNHLSNCICSLPVQEWIFWEAFESVVWLVEEHFDVGRLKI